MKYVLIAEDDPAIAELITEAVCDNLYIGCHVVANGALVPDAITARRPDLLILDVGLPGLSGLDVFDLAVRIRATTDPPCSPHPRPTRPKRAFAAAASTP